MRAAGGAPWRVPGRGDPGWFVARSRRAVGLTEADGRRFDVKYPGDCAEMFNNPPPSSMVRVEAEEEAKRQVLGDLQPPSRTE